MHRALSDTAFSEAQQLAAYAEGVERNFWHIARNNLIFHYLSKWRAEPLLEIGAGRGFVLAYLLNKGWDVKGVELTPLTASTPPNLPIRYGQDAFELPAEERMTYCSVALFDVLEHIPERVYFLRQIKEHFVRMRYLYLTVPAGMGIWSVFDRTWGHFLRYDISTLEGELEKAGYRLIFWRYFFHSLYWIIWLTIKLIGRRAESFEPPRGWALLFHRMVGELMYWEGRILPRSWRGSSLLAIAEPI
ncbi:MAG: hypothetical protein RMJ66_02160 [Bacteroidia bacterium]|nr:class I SAM-dependent methyltransferase [Bacteroidia bacterium]MDW8133851.1 hypothetical protein [Bacteroidia bacterium]